MATVSRPDKDCDGSNEDFFRVRDLDYHLEQLCSLKS